MAYLPDRDAIVNLQSGTGSTPLYFACEQGRNKDIVKMLLDRRADINIQSDDGSTPLHIACEKGHKDIV